MISPARIANIRTTALRLADEGRLTSSALADVLVCSRSQARRWLARFEAEGIVRVERVAKQGRSRPVRLWAAAGF